MIQTNIFNTLLSRQSFEELQIGQKEILLDKKEQGREKDKISHYLGPQSTLFGGEGQSWLGVWRLVD